MNFRNSIIIIIIIFGLFLTLGVEDNPDIVIKDIPHVAMDDHKDSEESEDKIATEQTPKPLIKKVTIETVKRDIYVSESVSSKDEMSGSSTKVGNIGVVGGDVDLSRTKDNHSTRTTSSRTEEGLKLEDIKRIISDDTRNFKQIQKQDVSLLSANISSKVKDFTIEIDDVLEEKLLEMDTKATANTKEIKDKTKTLDDKLKLNTKSLEKGLARANSIIEANKESHLKNLSTLTTAIYLDMNATVEESNKKLKQLDNKHEKQSSRLDTATQLLDRGLKVVSKTVSQNYEELEDEIAHAKEATLASLNSKDEIIKIRLENVSDAIEDGDTEQAIQNKLLDSKINDAKALIASMEDKAALYEQLTNARIDKAINQLLLVSKEQLAIMREESSSFATKDDLVALEKSILALIEEGKTLRLGEIFIREDRICPSGSYPLDGTTIENQALIYLLGDTFTPNYNALIAQFTEDIIGCISCGESVCDEQ